MKKIDPVILARLRELLEEITGNTSHEVLMDSHLEDDLGLDLDIDSSRLLTSINREFEIKLEEDTLIDELEEAGATVISLAQLINDECELG